MQIKAKITMHKSKAQIRMRHIFTAQFYYGFGADSYYGFATDKLYGYNAPITKEGRMRIHVM